jgi:large subunit ribosomal protein L10
MDNPRPEKVAAVAEVKEHFSAADAALITEYRGMSVTQLAKLRRAVRTSGGTYKVYKNTLARLGAREAGVEGADDLLVGPTGILFVQGDVAAVAKSLREFAKTEPKLVIKGGVLGGKPLTAAQVDALADLPSREVLLAQIAGAFQAPMATMAGLLAALPRNFAYGLKALIDERGGVPAEAA